MRPLAGASPGIVPRILVRLVLVVCLVRFESLRLATFLQTWACRLWIIDKGTNYNRMEIMIWMNRLPGLSPPARGAR